MKERALSFQTKSGCRKLIGLFVCLILLFSFAAGLIQSSGGKVNIVNVKFDARGAVQDADLYTPVGTNSGSALPCVILSHGGGCTKGVMTGFAEELARRGYVVLNVSSYGAGLSGQPMYDEDGLGVETMGVQSQGVWDAINYVRTLTFVDQTKIVIAGHSQGGYRVCYTALHDCSFLSLNDTMINFMHDEFGIAFTEAEISEDAGALAEKYLDETQMLCYNAKYAEEKEFYDTRIKGVVSIGNTVTGVPEAFGAQTVNVAGYEVKRFLQTNLALLCGQWDHNFMFLSPETAATEYFQTGESMPIDTWVEVNAASDRSSILGSFDAESIVSNAALAAAIENRTSRVYIAPERITHSREFLSNSTVTDLIQYVEQVLDYNNGPLTGSNSALDPHNIIWLSREACNFLAMLAMIGLAVSMLALLRKKEGLELVTYTPDSDKLIEYGKPQKITFYALCVLILTYCSYLSNNSMKMLSKPLVVVIPSTRFFPLDKTSAFIYVYLFWGAILLAALLAGMAIFNKLKRGKTGLETLGIKVGFKGFAKALLVSFIVFITCYASLIVIRYLFNQDYRMWMCVFTDMQLIHWTQAIRYLIFLLPTYFVFSAAINFIGEKKGDNKVFKAVLIAVLLGSAGVWINSIVHVIGLYTGSDAAKFFVKLISEGSICGGMLIFVPISIFIAKYTHKLTGSIWTGTLINAFFTAWMWVSAISSTNVYMGTTFVEKFFGF